MFGRRRRQEQAAEAARESERRALFERLAQRPDTVCPFLGLADDRVAYSPETTEAHRCYAFGDPAPLSFEQQERVCLQRGYGNCPRYLRGVLVIPTEELEALRRPQPMPVAAAETQAEATTASRRPFRAILSVLAVLLVLGAIGGAGFWYLRNQVGSSAATASLPGGTDLGGELVSLSEPAGGQQQLRGTASIGETKAVANTVLVYVLDISSSTLGGQGCGGDPNDDGVSNTALDCEIAAAEALNKQAIDSGTVAEVGLVGFADGAVTGDLAPRNGNQPLVKPGADDDGDGTPNVVEVMRSAYAARRPNPVGLAQFSRVEVPAGRSAFSDGISAACGVLEGATSPNRLVVFLSDGANVGGVAVTDVLPCGAPAVFNTFAAGQDASCARPSELGTLQQVASLTEGTCTDVTDLAKLPQVLQAVVAPQILRVEVTVDGGKPIDVSKRVVPSLPLSGPADVSIEAPIPQLGDGDHRVCMTVFASDAGGPGSVTSCSGVGAGGGRLTSN